MRKDLIKTELKYLNINLNAFEGGAGGAAGAATGGGEGTAAPTAGSEQAVPQDYDPKKAVYGKQEPKNGKDKANERVDLTPAEQFDNLIKGEHKEAFTKKMQTIIDSRFKQTKELESEVGQLKPLAELMMKKMDVKSVEELTTKLGEEVLQEEAYEKDIPLDAYRKMKADDAKIKELEDFKNKRMRAEDADRKVAEWLSQESKVKESYPDFNMKEYLHNKDFISLLHNGVDAKTAYEVLNMDTIKSGIATNTESAVVQNIQARGLRPNENGTKRQRGVVTKTDVKTLTAKDRAEIARRASRGAVIKL